MQTFVMQASPVQFCAKHIHVAGMQYKGVFLDEGTPDAKDRKRISPS